MAQEMSGQNPCVAKGNFLSPSETNSVAMSCSAFFAYH